ncbi:excisionase family DNA-binding protein [Lentzea sp. NPDC004789]
MDSSLITVQAAADLLSVSRWTIYRLIWDNAVKSVQIGRSRRIVKASLEAYVQELIEEAA